MHTECQAMGQTQERMSQGGCPEEHLFRCTLRDPLAAIQFSHLGFDARANERLGRLDLRNIGSGRRFLAFCTRPLILFQP